VVGGSSAINFTGYNKPSREDIDGWWINNTCFRIQVKTDENSLGEIRK